jgi:NitT/TauT family transport system permease protein
MLVALALSIVFSLAVGILAARNKRAESVVIPLLDIFQSIPILGFFPIVILGIIAVFPSNLQLGVNLAVILLIFTSMSWNIAFGVYEAVKSIPQDYVDLTSMTSSGSLQRIKSLYIPASLSRIAYNTQTSWAVGLFYLISSEILTLGTSNFTVKHGIGVDIMSAVLSGNYAGYVYSLIALIVAVIIWQFVFLREFALWSERYKFVEEPRAMHKDFLLRFYSWVNEKSISKLFLLGQARGVTRFSSSLNRFRRGLKYAVVICALLFFVFEIAALSASARSGLATLPPSGVILSDEASVLVALAFSFLRIWYVYFICVAVAVPVGILIALHSRLYETLVPVIEVIASVPAPALLPAIAVVAVGAGEEVAAFIIFLGMIWYVLFNVMAGIRTLPREYHELRSILRVSNVRAWKDIYVPATLSAFVTGSITAVGAAWNTLIVAEYFSPSGGTPLTQVGTGIGKTIVVATNNGDLVTLSLAVLSMTALVVAFNLTVWRRVYNFATKRYSYNV